MYYNPPIVLLLAGMIGSLLCGKAFEAVLRQEVTAWSKKRDYSILEKLQGKTIILPYFGICIGIFMFQTIGLFTFGLTIGLSVLVGFLATLFLAVLVWGQLRNLLLQLEAGGSESLEYK